MADLIAWLDDTQERKPFSRVAPTDAIVEAFDSLLNRLGTEDFVIPDRILELYDQGQQGMEGRGRTNRRWRFENNLAKFLVPKMLNKIKHAVQTRHKINYRYGYELRNIENGEYTLWYTNINSPWIDRLSKTKEWLQEQEWLRLQGGTNRQTQHEIGFSKTYVG